MKLLNAIAAAAVIGIASITVNPVNASSCNEYQAALKVEKYMAIGLSYSEAVEKTKAKGLIPDFECELEMRGEISYYGLTFPRAKKALGL